MLGESNRFLDWYSATSSPRTRPHKKGTSATQEKKNISQEQIGIEIEKTP